ncbi:hypothetical protein CWS72_21605 [Telmatospirillum siberiense]|uniref:Uncharacterized protein n=2 Tax=Telmatospirillum siberiense TaxID=382514 RepID=A0A2N3PPS0_9PROT|nr:hypothetical protein CWS72_21605 [Telmatospirillum siberiense]
MAIFKREGPSVQIGDRFIKRGDSLGQEWVIIRLWTTVDGLPHARMESSGRGQESRIISVSALTDPYFFSPVSHP